MNDFKVIVAEFEKGIVDPSLLSSQEFPEIAIVGRSNAGKSSLINRLTNSKKLARVSSTPGRTQELNSFLVKLRDSSAVTRQIRLIDLPGFGYAKLSHTQRQQLQELINAYLSKARLPNLVLLLNDSKRLPACDEIDIRNYCFERDIPVLVLLTKCDRLNRKELDIQLKQISSAYGLENSDVVLTGEKMSVSDVWERVFLSMT